MVKAKIKKGWIRMYLADSKRYDKMKYNRCGRSGLLLSACSLGLWHNFGSVDSYENMLNMLKTAFDAGITHFDAANNYGPVPGSAEENLGKALKNEFKPYRDELIISSKAGYRMWEGPYGDRGSKKYLIASLDQSLKRLGLDYVDIFYHHCPDLDTPLEETAEALEYAVRSGKALYVGISSYSAERTAQMADVLKARGIPLTIHQPEYNILNRWIEDGLQDVLEEKGIGSIAFCPLAQGLLTNKYFNGIPENSRGGKVSWFADRITPENIEKAKKLEEIAKDRGQTLAQMALSWILRDGKVTSVLMGASRPEQITENVEIINKTDFTEDEIKAIDSISIS